MSFFNKVLHYVVNNLLVEGLANSRTFQRFAVWSNDLFKQGAEQSKSTIAPLREQASVFTKTFSETFQKELEKVVQQNMKPPIKPPSKPPTN